MSLSSDEEARQAAMQAMQEQTARMSKAPTMTVSLEPKYVVMDLRALWDARPELCRIEPNKMAIQAELRGGMRECPGLRIWEDVSTTVRS